MAAKLPVETMLNSIKHLADITSLYSFIDTSRGVLQHPRRKCLHHHRIHPSFNIYSKIDQARAGHPLHSRRRLQVQQAIQERWGRASRSPASPKALPTLRPRVATENRHTRAQDQHLHRDGWKSFFSCSMPRDHMPIPATTPASLVEKQLATHVFGCCSTTFSC